MTLIQKPKIKYGQKEAIEKSYPVNEFYNKNSEKILGIENEPLRSSIINALALLASYDTCIPDIEIDFGDLEDELQDIDFGDLEDELQDIDFGELEGEVEDVDFGDLEGELQDMDFGDSDLAIHKPTEPIKPPKKKYSRKDRPSPSVSATEYPVGIQKIGNDDNVYEVVTNKNGVKRWKKVKAKPKKTVSLETILEDMNNLPSELRDGEDQSLSIEPKYNEVLFETRYLGNWDNDEEDRYDDDFDESDWEDNDQRVWLDYSHYNKIFRDWVKQQDWADLVSVDVESGEKDWAYFTVRIKNQK